MENTKTLFVFGHHVRPYGKIGRTISKFGRTMSDDRLLFPALLVVIVALGTISRDLDKHSRALGLNKVKPSQLQKAALLGTAHILRKYL